MDFFLNVAVRRLERNRLRLIIAGNLVSVHDLDGVTSVTPLIWLRSWIDGSTLASMKINGPALGFRTRLFERAAASGLPVLEREGHPMDTSASNFTLSQMATQWSVVRMAHRDQAPEAKAARRQLLEQYGGAARRYLLGAVRDPDAAADLFQEFAVRLMQGDLRGADQDRGRFRHYVKAVLCNLTADHFRQRQRKARELTTDVAAAETPDDQANELDAAFVNSWREELLARAWQALAQLDEKNSQPYHMALRFRADHPEATSAEMAEALSAQVGRPLTVVNVRQILHRAREFFAEHLLAHVTASLTEPTVEQIEDELLELRLLEYCRSALGKLAPEMKRER